MRLLIVLLGIGLSGCSPETNPPQLISKTWTQYLPDTTNTPATRGSVYSEEIRTYNSTGSTKDIVSFVNGAPSYRIVFDNDETERTARADYFDSNDSLASYYRYEFTEDFREQRYGNYTLDTDSLLYEVEFRYPSDTLKQSGYLDDAGDFVWTYNYFLDSNGNEVRAEFKSGGDVIKINYDIETSHPDGKWATRKVVGPGGQIWFFEEQAFEYESQ